MSYAIIASNRLREALQDSSSKTTGLYDRRNDDISLDEVERIGI